MDNKNLSLYILVAAETFHSQSQFMPGLEELSKDAPDQHKPTVRRAQIYSGVWSFLVAAAVAHALNSPYPLLVWLAVGGITCAIYEYHILEGFGGESY